MAKLHYQLFSGVAGTLAAAAEVKIDLVAFVVHDFETRDTKPHKQANNRSALADFMVRVFGRTTPSPDDKWWLRGPFTVPAKRWASITLWVGHLATRGLPARS